MDFHLLANFVNLSLLVLPHSADTTPVRGEHAILTDSEPIPGRLEIDPAAGVIFRSADRTKSLPVRLIRKVVNTATAHVAPGTSPAHRLVFWGNESLSGTVQSLDAKAIQLITPTGDRLCVPLYLISKIEHFQGDAVVFRDDFENEQVMRRVAGEPQKNSERSSSGQWSFRLGKAGDMLEYRLPEPIAAGWFEVKFYDSAETHAGLDWVCELEFDSQSGVRSLQVLLGWASDSYGLATPQGPAFPVQRLARHAGWSKLGVRHALDSTTVSIDDAVLTHRDVGVGSLRAIRFVVRASENAEAAAPGREGPAGFVDDLQIAATIASATERQPARDQDDATLINGDQLFGQVQSATGAELTIVGEFGNYSLAWRRLHEVHFVSRPAPSKRIDGQRARVQFAATSTPRARDKDSDAIEGVLRELTDEFISLEHPHIGRIRIPRGQMREMEFFSSGGWLAIDPRYYHFGDQVNVRFQVPHQQGSDLSWQFSLDEVPANAALVLRVTQMDARAPGADTGKKWEIDEWRTYTSINGQKVDPQGLNHLLPLNYRGDVRLVVPIPPGILKKGENVLRIHQTPQRDNANSFNDCGIFSIGLELSADP